MNHPLQCRCGTIKGYVVRPGMGKRAVCYCKDCQAYAHFLKQAGAVLDGQGGTAIVATLAGGVHFTQGREALTCMALSGKGMYRWYAGCCNTPIGNTPRDFKTPYVGLIETCLQSTSPSIGESFGAPGMVLNTQSAKGHVDSTPLKNLAAILGIMKTMIGARLKGAYKNNPFFDTTTGKPVVTPRELGKAERAQLADAG